MSQLELIQQLVPSVPPHLSCTCFGTPQVYPQPVLLAKVAEKHS